VNSERDTAQKRSILNAKMELLELSLNIKTYEESMDIFNHRTFALNESKKALTFNILK
jgi:hypothetical protein